MATRAANSDFAEPQDQCPTEPVARDTCRRMKPGTRIAIRPQVLG